MPQETKDTNKASELETVVTIAQGKSRKKGLAILCAIAVILAVVVGIVVVSGSSGKKLQEQLDLGNKYLQEMDYERAVAAFNAVLEIDPKNPDAYKGLVDAYYAMGDMDSLLETLDRAAAELEGEAADNFMDYASSRMSAYIEEIYVKNGQYDNALRYAQRGYDVTKKEEMQKLVERITQLGDETGVVADSADADEEKDSVGKKTSTELLRILEGEDIEKLLKLNEVVVLGTEVTNPNSNWGEDAFWAAYIERRQEYLDENHQGVASLLDESASVIGTERIFRLISGDSVIDVMYDIYDDSAKKGAIWTDVSGAKSGDDLNFDFIDIEARDIHLRDTLPVVLEKMGFAKSSEIGAFVEALRQEEVEDSNAFWERIVTELPVGDGVYHFFYGLNTNEVEGADGTKHKGLNEYSIAYTQENVGHYVFWFDGNDRLVQIEVETE